MGPVGRNAIKMLRVSLPWAGLLIDVSPWAVSSLGNTFFHVWRRRGRWVESDPLTINKLLFYSFLEPSGTALRAGKYPHIAR